MERKRTLAIKTISCTFLGILSLALMDYFLFIPVSSSYSSFYEEKKNSLDVVLIGNSTLREGYIPILSYHEYGFTNYSITASPTHLEVIKIAIEETARTQKPKMVFVDISGLTFQSHSNQAMYVREYVSSMPESDAKEEYYRRYDYLRRDEDDFLFAHHNAFRQQIYWEALVYQKAAHTKGYYPNELVVTVNPSENDPNKTLPLSEDANLYMDEILEVASRYDDIDFVFGRMPRIFSAAVEEDTYKIRSVAKKVRDAGHDFIDFTDDYQAIGIDPNGAQKDNEHDEDVVKAFDDCYEGYEVLIDPIERKLGMK